MNRYLQFCAVVAILAGSAIESRASARVGLSLSRLAAESPAAVVPVWVYFTDRAGMERDPEALVATRAALTPRSLDRRRRRGTLSDVSASDLPVHAPYVRALLARGARLRGTSRWLNAASVEIPAGLAPELSRWPFVARVERVASGRPLRPVNVPSASPADAGAGIDSSPDRDSPRLNFTPGDTAYYGGSFRQLNMMQAPALHGLGFTGAGILVAMLDSGFRVTHQALAGLNVVATRDFIHGDLNVDDESGQDPSGAAGHGTATLACVGGRLPGVYSGSAFGASFALAKTEDIASETPVEMDYWQFGAEWADSLGADIIASSLGYSDFDSPFPSYTYADMDGRTTTVTLAAVEAMRRGITVVNSAGNSGGAPWFYIIAPADADSMVAVGAVDSFNVVTSFSSHGPTSDGRTKPDVTAMGRSVLTIPLASNSTYVRLSGTSFSAPLVSGLAALLLEAHPAWTPVQVRDALRETALNHATPDNTIGWGLVQGVAAHQWTPAITGVPSASPRADGLALMAGPNPLRAGTGARIRFSAPAGFRVALDVVDVTGRLVSRLFEGVASGEEFALWSGTGPSGSRVGAGIYWVRLTREGGGEQAGLSPGGAGASRVVRLVLLP
ncbi:MAG: S8 family serine peptidase [Candidatus Eisenbacteria bacterium]